MPSKYGNEQAHERRERKRAEANARQAERNKRGDEAQLEHVRRWFNPNGKEARKLNARLAAADAAERRKKRGTRS